MPRLSIDKLPRAPSKYRRAVRAAIETLEEARREDAIRARLLRTVVSSGSSLVDAEWCSNLADWLDLYAESALPLNSRASARQMREHRIDIASLLHRLIDSSGLRATTFTLVSSRWTVPAHSLPSHRPELWNPCSFRTRSIWDRSMTRKAPVFWSSPARASEIRSTSSGSTSTRPRTSPRTTSATGSTTSATSSPCRRCCWRSTSPRPRASPRGRSSPPSRPRSSR